MDDKLNDILDIVNSRPDPIRKETKSRIDKFFDDDTNSMDEKLNHLVNLALTHKDIIEIRATSNGGDNLALNGNNGESSKAVGGTSGRKGAKSRRKRPRIDATTASSGDECSSNEPMNEMAGFEIDQRIIDHQLCVEFYPPGTSAEDWMVPTEDHPADCSWDDQETATEDEGVDDEIANVSGPPNSAAENQNTPTPAELINKKKAKQAKPLLSKKYFLPFSHQARRQTILGSERTIAEAANAKRMIVERRQLNLLFKRTQCTVGGCEEMLKMSTVRYKKDAYTNKVTAVCNGGHAYTWTTSPEMQHLTNEHSAFYPLNISIPSAVMTSGQGYDRMRNFADIANIDWGSSSHHYRIQAYAVIPTVDRCTKLSQQEMFEYLRKLPPTTKIILSGDGQYDSPGTCAKTCTYSLILAGLETENQGGAREFLESNYIVCQVVVDRRHADDNSPKAEQVGVHAALRILREAGVRVDELITDEHSQIVADFKRVKAALAEREANKRKMAKRRLFTKRNALMEKINSPLSPCDETNIDAILDYYANIHHSLDLWHKAKNVKKRVERIATQTCLKKEKEKDVYREYAKELDTHLWWCAEVAAGCPEAFKHFWLSSIAHCQGQHHLCTRHGYGLTPFHKTKLPDLNPDTDAFRELKKYIESVGKLSSQLCRFRHTGSLENYHSMGLAFTSKRNDYKVDAR